MKLAVVGAGLIGLTTAAGFADLGHRVLCCDSDSGKIGLLARGTVSYREPGLESLVQRNVSAGRLRFGEMSEELMRSAEIVFLAVETPSADDGQLQMAPFWAAADRLGSWDACSRIVAIVSTVPVGTAERLEARLRARLPGHAGVDVASLPVFLREGSAVRDFYEPSRIVIGTACPETAERLDLLHQRLPGPIVHADRRSAELAKLAANAHLALRISFANELAALAEQTGADYPAVAQLIGLDPRIGPHSLGAGLGFGGPSLPKDARAYVRLADEAGAPQTLVSAAIRANAMLPLRMVRKLEAALSGPARRKVALLGLTFKPGSEDMREAPSLRLIAELLRRHPGITLTAYDPAGQSPAVRHALPNAVQLCGSAEEALTGADATILVTEWQEFRKIPAQDYKNWMNRPIILDGRNALDAPALNAQGIVCIGVGRLPATPAEPPPNFSARLAENA
ncbi:UDP-glucose/GDP-mannose dehydrogenase family protein [Cohnella sp. REN36]|uniref:UDP-glucose dehydrogenase family protein n=1 Tax=Cohnella sp. REN36 TaxID=2887347 RepID=UPI001D148064|nr:UDP-glucose/GDP-mannose dehydrogenase family protein [Cohnella sp. REN36]MCC3374017.1 UDP-glucose/GDP-mannose dehydrogenase family protein [Cohnella sp. REN36]